ARKPRAREAAPLETRRLGAGGRRGRHPCRARSRSTAWGRTRGATSASGRRPPRPPWPARQPTPARRGAPAAQARRGPSPAADAASEAERRWRGHESRLRAILDEMECAIVPENTFLTVLEATQADGDRPRHASCPPALSPSGGPEAEARPRPAAELFPRAAADLAPEAAAPRRDEAAPDQRTLQPLHLIEVPARHLEPADLADALADDGGAMAAYFAAAAAAAAERTPVAAADRAPIAELAPAAAAADRAPAAELTPAAPAALAAAAELAPAAPAALGPVAAVAGAAAAAAAAERAFAGAAAEAALRVAPPAAGLGADLLEWLVRHAARSDARAAALERRVAALEEECAQLRRAALGEHFLPRVESEGGRAAPADAAAHAQAAASAPAGADGASAGAVPGLTMSGLVARGEATPGSARTSPVAGARLCSKMAFF
ncbi:unnamed protein product, partial [Prorocentrum cordatum]